MSLHPFAPTTWLAGNAPTLVKLRVEMAGRIAAGILANPYIVERFGGDFATVSKDAVMYTDAVLAELDKPLVSSTTEETP